MASTAKEVLDTLINFSVIDESLHVGFRHETRPKDCVVRETGAAGAFGKHEVEMVAGRLVKFFQDRGAWVSFTILELVCYFEKNTWDPNLMFFGLLGPWYDDSMLKGISDTSWTVSRPYLVIGTDGRYRVTNYFIERCAVRI